MTDHRGEREDEAGFFSATVVDVRGATTEGESVFDVFDSDETCSGYLEALYDLETDDFKPRVSRLASGDDYLWNPNLLILDRLMVYPRYRGSGLGLLALHGIMLRLRAAAGLIAMKPFPLQFQEKFLGNHDPGELERLGLNLFNVPRENARSKLRRYYAKLGFRRVPGTEYMVRSPELPLADSPALQVETGA
ncbi:MAG: hypothetical protein WDZ63_07415 [Burkholderiales bacterium]